MNLIKELYQLQEQQLLEAQQLLVEKADQILTISAAQLAHGKGLMDFDIVKDLANKEETGVSTLSKIFSGIEAIVRNAHAITPEKKSAFVNVLDKAENKTNDPYTAKLADIGEKAKGGQIYNDWKEQLDTLHSAFTSFTADTSNQEAKQAYMTLAKQMEARLKKLSTDIIKARAELEKDVKQAPSDTKTLDFTK